MVAKRKAAVQEKERQDDLDKAHVTASSGLHAALDEAERKKHEERQRLRTL